VKNIQSFMESAARKNPQKHAEIMAYCASTEIELQEFCNQFSLVIATGFYNGMFSYEFCDDAMNYLWGFMTDEPIFSSDKGIPEPAFSIYQAFDAGEYNHDGDATETDPVEKYTRPLIIDILSPSAAS
jgi:hypothetical protein